jgi:hypothetical protein
MNLARQTLLLRNDTHLPRYMTARLPALAAWNTHPATVIAPFSISENLLPFLSAIQELKKQPTKHPACSIDAMFAERSACWTLSSLSRP